MDRFLILNYKMGNHVSNQATCRFTQGVAVYYGKVVDYLGKSISVQSLNIPNLFMQQIFPSLFLLIDRNAYRTGSLCERSL